MTRRRSVAAALGLVLVAIVAVVWVIPTAQGPRIECPAAWSAEQCTEAATRASADAGPQTMPITRIVLEECGKTTVYVLVLWPAWAADCGLQPGPAPSPNASPVEEVVQLDLGRLEVDHPASWRYHEFQVSFNFDSVQGYLTTGPFDPGTICTKTRDTGAAGSARFSLSCDFSGHPVEPEGVVVIFGQGASMTNGISARPGETQAAVGRMPAYVSEARVGDTLTLTWRVRMPGAPNNWYAIEGKLREPGAEELRRQVEAIVASLRFDPVPTILPTSGPAFDRGAGEAAVQALTMLRTYVDSAGYACFVPAEPDATRTAEIEVVPPNRRLSQPLEVTCTTLVEADADMWRVRFVLEWSATDGHGAGRQETEVSVNAAGEAGYAISGSEPPYEVPAVPTSE